MTTQPPVAPIKPPRRAHHGIEFIDDYEWVRDREDPDTLAYIEAENAWTEAQIAHLRPLRDALFADFAARTQETDHDVPLLVRHRAPEGDVAYWYYRRTEEGKPYAIHCRLLASDPDVFPDLADPDVTARETVLLDENLLAEGQEFFELGEQAVSPSGRYLAYGTDTTGGEVFTIRILDLANGVVLPDTITGAHYGLEFLTDRDLYYTVADDAWRPHQVWQHRLGETDDRLVATEHDERFSVDVRLSRDSRWLLVGRNSTLTTEWSILSADEPSGSPRVIAPRRQGVDYSVEVAGDRLLILHNDAGPDFALAEAPLDATDAAQWRSILDHTPGVRLASVAAYDGHVVVGLRRDGLRGLHIIPRDSSGNLGAGEDITIGEDLYVVRHLPGANTTDHRVRYGYTSLVTPFTTADYSPNTGEVRTLRQTPVRDHPVHGAYRAEDYVQTREWATAPDGTRVPLSLVYRKGALDHGPRPTLLYGYGSYESSADPYFDVERLSLLDRGFVYAIAHVRGGGELGRARYEQGRVLSKRSTFTDFIACADHLIATGHTLPDLLAAQGQSAGGLLMGAVANLAGDRFRAIHAGVAFVDPLTTCLNPDFPLIIDEWEEWGDPLHDREAYEYLASYAPYDNVHEREYPAILATTSLNDIRVYNVEPTKWVAKLRTHAKNAADRPILLKTEIVAGHGGPSGRYGRWKQEAFELAWIIDQVAPTPTPRATFPNPAR